MLLSARYAFALFLMFLIPSDLHLCSNAANVQESETLNSIFDIKYTTLNGTQVNQTNIRSRQCRSSSTEYRLRLAENYPGVFRVPHSRIFEDGVRCGDKNDSYSESLLYIEPHMKLVPYTYMKNESTATEAGILTMYNAFNDSFRTHVRNTSLNLEHLVADNDLWIGFEEGGDRRCGDNVVLERGAYLLFGRTTESRGIDLSFGMIDPASRSNYTLKYEYPPKDHVHISFDEKFVQTTASFDRVCAAHSDAVDLQKPPSKSSDPEESESSCFPAIATVKLASGVIANMSSLGIGTSVIDVGGVSTEIFMFTHHDSSSRQHRFLSIEMEDMSVLRVSRGHYIMTHMGMVPASSVRPGWRLVREENVLVPVKTVSMTVLPGLYNPQTLSGSLVVDGYEVSTYTTAVSPVYAHALLAPLRFLYRSRSPGARIFESLTCMLRDGAGMATPFLRSTLRD